MSDRYGSYPPDEPVIGASYPPSVTSAPDEPYISASGYGPQDDDYEEDDEYYDDEYDDDEYYDDGYYEETPARQPLFYVFVGLAALVGGIIIFLLITLLNGGSDGSKAAATDFKVLIQSPLPNARIEVGKAEDVAVSAKSTEQITRFELFRDDQSVDSQSLTSEPGTDGTYTANATLKLPAFDRKGTSKIFVRVTSVSGAHKDSDPVTLIAIEPVGAKPQTIKGKVIADAGVHDAPQDESPVTSTITSGAMVTILGRTTDSSWLLIDVQNGRWVKRNAIEPQDSLDLVPVRDPTPVPAPSPTNTTVATPSPQPSPTVDANAPDFVAQNASLEDGGARLQVTVTNSSAHSYTGPLVVAVSGVNPGTLTQVFSVNLPANGSTTVSFDLNPVVSTQVTATVRVDPENAIKEANEDNNRVAVVLQPPVAQPDLVITNSAIGPDSVTVTIKNNGGALPSSSVKVRLSLDNGNATDSTKSIALAKGQEISFAVPRPGNGDCTVTVLVDDVPVASSKITIT